MNEVTKTRFSNYLKDNDGMRLEIKPLTPESRGQRGYYHAAVITLWCYLDGNNYRDGQKLNQYHELAKRQFNGEILITKGKRERVGKTTKGSLSKVINDTIDYLEENYGIDRMKVLDPEKYKYFRDKIYMNGDYDTYINYLIDIGDLQ